MTSLSRYGNNNRSLQDKMINKYIYSQVLGNQWEVMKYYKVSFLPNSSNYITIFVSSGYRRKEEIRTASSLILRNTLARSFLLGILKRKEEIRIIKEITCTSPHLRLTMVQLQQQFE